MTENNSLEASSEELAQQSSPAEDEKQQAEKDLPEGKSQEEEKAVEGDAPEADEPEVELSADALEWKEKFEKTQAATQKRIDRQTAANRQLQEQLSELNKQLEQYKPDPKDDAPKEEDFDSYEDYLKEQGKYEARKEFEAEQQQKLQAEREAKQQEIREAKQKQFNERVESVKAQHPDYQEKEAIVDEVVDEFMRNNNGQPTPTLQILADALLESESGARIIYELGGQPEKAEEILSMTPLEAMRELVMLESKPKAVEQPKKQPEPIKPSSGSGKGSKPLNKTSEKEFKQWLTS